MKLTDRQNEAVHSKSGNVLVHAGAGSGKTACFTARIANLIGNEKVDPESILGLTFTKDAAENMRSRLKGLIGKKKSDKVHLTTFHSFAYGILKSNYPSAYQGKQIAQSWWSMSKLYDIVSKQSYGNNVGLNMSIKAGELGSFISYQKSNMIKIGMDVIIDENVSYVSGESRESLQKAFDTYCELVRNARIIEFDDMLVDLYYKLLDDKNLLKDIRSKYKYVMVDEFQDTNTINMEIIKLISDNNLFVVGDFRQGIYGFINANINNILDFNSDFENVHLIELQENFRSTDNIVNFANNVISASPVEKYKQFSEQLPARGVVGSNIDINVYTDDYTEVTSIGEDIKDMVENGYYDYSDFAILSRTNTLLGFYESEFANMDIPVDLSSGKSFFDRKEISDLLAYAEHTVDESDDMSMRKIINSPSRFVSKALTNQLDEYAYNNSISFEQACSAMDCGKSNTNIKNMVRLFDQLRDHEDVNASKFLKEVYRKIGYEKHMESKTPSVQELQMKKDAIERLFELAKKFTTIKKFLGHISVIRSNNKKSKDGVKMMTVHGSKGLEFRYVFLPSVTKDNFPHDMSNDVEEERRLFYVASSRAKECMSISTPVFTAGGTSTYIPSPFLVDVVGTANMDSARKAVMRGSHKSSFEY